MKAELQVVANHDVVSACPAIAGMMAGLSPALAWTEMAGLSSAANTD